MMTDAPQDDADFAEEHDDTTVDEEVSAGEDDDRESESPEGLGGMDLPGHPA